MNHKLGPCWATVKVWTSDDYYNHPYTNIAITGSMMTIIIVIIIAMLVVITY